MSDRRRARGQSRRPGLPWALIAAVCPLLAQVGLLVVTLTGRNWSFVMMLLPGILMSAAALVPALTRWQAQRRRQAGPEGHSASPTGRPPDHSPTPWQQEPGPSAGLSVPVSSSLLLLRLQQASEAYRSRADLWKLLVRSWRLESPSWAVAIGLQADSAAAESQPTAEPGEPTSNHESVNHGSVNHESVNHGSVPFYLDILAQGPHALVAGTTGSGKSVFLQAWCAALALEHSPSSLNFVFLDFKGGSTFRLLHRLPHVVGFVSDLNLVHARRALRAIEAELTRREALIAAAGVSSLDELDNPPARLVIVVDEFHALRFALPDYAKHLVRIAAQGRSLGMNLILSTQNPLGQVSADMKANINLNVCLRVRDRLQSLEMLGDGLACELPATSPGLAVVNDSERMTVFRSATLQEPSQLVAQCVRAARFCLLEKPAALFSPALPSRLPMPAWRPPDPTTAWSPSQSPGSPPSTAKLSALAIGLYDDGVLTHPCSLDLRAGNLAVIGSRGRGQTGLLRALRDQLGLLLPHAVIRHSVWDGHSYRAMADRRERQAPSLEDNRDQVGWTGPATPTDRAAQANWAEPPDGPSTSAEWAVWLVEGADQLLDPLTSNPLRDEFLTALADRSRRLIFTVESAARVRFPEHCASRIVFPSGEPTVDILAGIPAELQREWDPNDVTVEGRAVLLTASTARTIQCFQKK